MAVIPSQQVLSGIAYAQSTPENLAVANSATGGTATSLTNIIAPVSLETGKIYFTQGNTAVTGIGTEFENDFNEGDFIYYYDRITASPALVGKIAAIGGNTGITLTGGAPVTIASTDAVYCGKTTSLLSTLDNIIIRIPVNRDEVGNFYLPFWANWRQKSGANVGFNDLTGSRLERYSAVGNPATPVAPPLENILYTITPLIAGWNKYVDPGTRSGANVLQDVRYFADASTIPAFAYALFNPFGVGNKNLSPNTLFKLFASQSFAQNCIQATTGYSASDLQAAGYPV